MVHVGPFDIPEVHDVQDVKKIETSLNILKQFQNVPLFVLLHLLRPCTGWDSSLCYLSVQVLSHMAIGFGIQRVEVAALMWHSHSGSKGV